MPEQRRLFGLLGETRRRSNGAAAAPVSSKATLALAGGKQATAQASQYPSWPGVVRQRATMASAMSFGSLSYRLAKERGRNKEAENQDDDDEVGMIFTFDEELSERSLQSEGGQFEKGDEEMEEVTCGADDGPQELGRRVQGLSLRDLFSLTEATFATSNE
jgi:hypothetical protein